MPLILTRWEGVALTKRNVNPDIAAAIEGAIPVGVFAIVVVGIIVYRKVYMKRPDKVAIALARIDQYNKTGK